jgi:D-beta-D-heptose 7-phosphate kinase / D-beta-D-heptose 1-phosphate adenosyltransferase
MHQAMIDLVRAGFAGPDGQAPTVLVVGDLMLDRYLWGDVERISPEAPVPVVRLNRETERLGGAGNVAANLAGLGIRARLAGFIGDDANGDRLLRLFAESGIDVAGVTRSQARGTIAKTRVIGGHQQMLRLDREDSAPYPAADQADLAGRVLGLLREATPPAAVILSDYAKGVLGADLCRQVIDMARSRGIPVLVDPKGRDYGKYRGATTLTPNKKETAEICGVPARDTAALLAAAARLGQELGLDFMTVTRGEEGISLIDGAGVTHLPATARQVFDVSGAGDTVIATLAAGLLAGLVRSDAAHLANLAAGIVVGQVGTVPIQRDELLHALEVEDAVEQADKVCGPDVLLRRVQAWRRQGARIVFTNGCFDLLHAGHVTYLERARQQGDRLVVGLNTDRSVSALKGPSRPVIQEHDRARVLAALESVDAVVLFDEDTPIELIRALRPDVLVKGSDYTEAQVVGAEDVKSWGGRVALIDFLPGRSSTTILNRIAGD